MQLYGDNTIDKILENPSKLDSISGLSKENKDNFLTKLKLNYGTEIILAKLAEYGLTNRVAFEIFNQYKEDSLDIIQENPYQLVEDIQGIGFKIADQLAEQLGIEADAPHVFVPLSCIVFLKLLLSEEILTSKRVICLKMPLPPLKKLDKLS